MENYSQYKKIIWKYIRTLQYDYMYLRRDILEGSIILKSLKALLEWNI